MGISHKHDFGYDWYRHLTGFFQIESFKSFFLVIETPPSIIQGEVFEVKVLLFNYIETGPEELQVSLDNLELVSQFQFLWLLRMLIPSVDLSC